MSNIKNIIFDLGGVLIDWNPEYLYKKIIPEADKRKWFLENICTLEWNDHQDGGRTIKEANEILITRYPEYKELIEAYYGRWEEMLNGSFAGTVDIFRDLKESKRFGIYALTNWSAETFPRALELFEFLHWFDGRLVSGEENTKKPLLEIYELIFSRFNLDPKETIFIDDNIKNIEGAKPTGLKCIHFTSPEDLTLKLKEFDIFLSAE